MIRIQTKRKILTDHVCRANDAYDAILREEAAHARYLEEWNERNKEIQSRKERFALELTVAQEVLADCIAQEKKTRNIEVNVEIPGFYQEIDTIIKDLNKKRS